MKRFISTTIIFAVAVVAMAIQPSNCRAQSGANIFTETTDTGNTIPTALILGPGFTQVNGSLTNDQDLWGFDVSASQSLQITLGLSGFDDNLILFDALGRGIAGNDDINRGSASPAINLPSDISGLDSEIVANLDPGRYYIAVGSNNIFGVSTDAINAFDSFITNDSGLLSSPTTEVLDFIGGAAGQGNYRLTFSSPTAAIPEPTSTVVLSLCALGLASARRRRLQ